MKREPRYFILKISDVKAAKEHDLLSQDELFALNNIAEKVNKFRKSIQGKDVLNAVVIEKDWPEYSKVWEMLERRVDGKKEPAPLKEKTEDDYEHSETYGGPDPYCMGHMDGWNECLKAGKKDG